MRKEEAFRELFEANYPKLLRLAFSILNNGEDARDTVNEVFANLWESGVFLREGFSVGMLSVNVKNRCIDHLRHLRVKDRFTRIYLALNKTDADMEPDDERLVRIDEVMAKMPPRTRFVMDQCYREGRKYRDVAAILGISESGVKKHVMKGLKMLRDVFSSEIHTKKIPEKP